MKQLLDIFQITRKRFKKRNAFSNKDRVPYSLKQKDKLLKRWEKVDKERGEGTYRRKFE